MESDWNLSQEEWRLMSSCNEAARQASPHDAVMCDSLALHWYTRCKRTGEKPQKLLLERCPNINKQHVQQRLNKFRRGY